jgi:hypothetical protein
MLLDWLEQRLEYKQRKRLRKLIDNLIEIVYVNVLFMVMASIIVLPLLALIFWSDQSMGVCGNC